MKSYVGMDVHSKSSVFVIQNERGEELGRGEVPTSVEGFSSLRLRFRLRASTLVALESGTMAFFAARKLSELGLSPVFTEESVLLFEAPLAGCLLLHGALPGSIVKLGETSDLRVFSQGLQQALPGTKGSQVLAAQLGEPCTSKHFLGRVDLGCPEPHEVAAAREGISQIFDLFGRHADDGSVDAAAKALAELDGIACVALLPGPMSFYPDLSRTSRGSRPFRGSERSWP